MSGGSQFFYVDMSKYRSYLNYCEIKRVPLNFNDYQHTNHTIWLKSEPML